MSTETKTILLSLDYHSDDGREAITRHECVLTCNEMRAIMMWITKLTFGDLPSKNLVVGLGKFYHMLRNANIRIGELEREIRGLKTPGDES